MTKDLAIIALGIWVAILPFLGFPNAWDRWILVLSGLAVALLMFLLRRDFFTYVDRLRRREQRKSDAYVENEIHGELEVVDEETHRRRKFHIDGVEEVPRHEGESKERRAKRAR